MTSEYQPQFENELEGAAEPGVFEGEQFETPHDPAESIKTGLTKLYFNQLEEINRQQANGSVDEEKATQLKVQLDRLSRTDLGYEISKVLSAELAKEIIGSGMFFGRDEVKKAFGIEVKVVPPIPFSSEELEKAKELGQFLVLRTNIAPDGQPLTMQKIKDVLQPEFDKEGKGRKVFFTASWYERDGRIEPFFVSENPQLGWVLTSRGTIPGSKRKNYLEQTEVLADYLENRVFADLPLPQEYRDAINQFNADKDEIRQLKTNDWRVAAQKLSKLKINQLCRQSPVDALYDELIYYQNKGERMLAGFTWTRAQTTNDSLVCVSGTDVNGPIVVGTAVNAHWPGYSDSLLGVSFSRRGVDLKS